jgi:hypothetical protein
MVLNGAREQVKHCHSNSNAILHLVEDNAVVGIGGIAAQLDAPIYRTGMHDDNGSLEAVKHLFRDTIVQRILA